jgi:hypothetical protein
MAEMELSLYDLNKAVMQTREPLTQQQLRQQLAEIASWFSFTKDTYYMLLCHERRDYTIFKFMDSSKRCQKGIEELEEVLLDRGQVIDITYEPDVYPIWVRIDGENYLYYLFPYDMGVIEV